MSPLDCSELPNGMSDAGSTEDIGKTGSTLLPMAVKSSPPTPLFHQRSEQLLAGGPVGQRAIAVIDRLPGGYRQSDHQVAAVGGVNQRACLIEWLSLDNFGNVRGEGIQAD